jgi:8-oxo-dGTP pyrophosphatase MutT (NUDIX family)
LEFGLREFFTPCKGPLNLVEFSFSDFLARAERHLLPLPPDGWNKSDDDMNEQARMIPDGVVTKPASVLIAIVNRGGVPYVVLTQRTAHLSNHGGQIAFPGGRRDDGETALQAALREAQEETGLAPEFVSPLGYLDGYLTVTHYLVTPVVALLREGFSLQAHAHEVDDIFEVPLSFLMNLENCQTHERAWKGMVRYYFVFPHGERYIWGATAGMIRNLYDRLYQSPA